MPLTLWIGYGNLPSNDTHQRCHRDMGAKPAATKDIYLYIIVTTLFLFGVHFSEISRANYIYHIRIPICYLLNSCFVCFFQIIWGLTFFIRILLLLSSSRKNKFFFINERKFRYVLLPHCWAVL